MVAFYRSLVLTGIVAIVLGGSPSRLLAQDELFNPYPLRPPNTASPRDTLQSFQQNARDAIRRFQAEEPIVAVERARARALRTLDLSQLPPAVRKGQFQERGLLLSEILDRIELPPLDEIPDAAAVDAEGLTSWTIPNTEIVIARTAEGPHAGEFQFTARTVALLPDFYDRAKHLPYKRGALIGIYEEMIYSPGPWLPLDWTTDLPSFAYVVILEQTVWQWLAALLIVMLTATVVVLIYLIGQRADHAAIDAGPPGKIGRIAATLVAIALIHLAARFIDDGVNITGTPLFVFELVLGVALATAVSGLIILVLNAIGDAIVRFRGSQPGNIDAQLIRIVIQVLSIILFVYIAIYLAETFGIPAAPLLAGAGVIGVAIGFGAQTLVRDIVSGVFFLLDDAFRLGEYVDIGGIRGTVEHISIRSLRLRHHRGALHTIPFGEIQHLTNHSRDWVIMKLMFRVPYDTDLGKVKKIFKKIGAEMQADPTIGPNLLEPPKSQGVLQIDDSAMVIRAKFMAKPGEQFVIRRELFQRVQQEFEAAGIQFARKQVSVYVPPGQTAEATAAAAAAAAEEKTQAAE